MYHDGYTHCISSANGFDGSGSASVRTLDNEALAEWVLSQVQFVGIATTEYKPSKAYSEQGFVAQVGGVTTLINEGESVIKPGDKVALGLNLKIGRKTARDKGIPRDKIRFCLVKAGNSRATVQKALGTLAAGSSTPAEIKKAEEELAAAKEALRKNKKAADKATLEAAVKTKETEARAKTLCKAGVDGMIDFLDKYQVLNERGIGKAASYARPGDRLEVILQPRNPY